MNDSGTIKPRDGINSPLSEGRLTLIFWGVFAALLLPWAWVQAQQATHSDLLWLAEAFSRLMAGHKVSDFIYETNPPLNILTYAIPVMLSKFSSIPLHYALFFYTSTLVLLSTLATNAILKCWPFLKKNNISIALAFMVIANTMFTSQQYGERDQYVGLALIPFTLMQLAITYKLPYPKALKWPVFLVGSMLILLKPHHGLIPTLLLLHRMIVQRRWTIVKDADFLSLLMMTSSYIAATWFFFPDFIKIILPDVLDLYLGMQNKLLTQTVCLFSVYLIAIFGLLAFIANIDRQHRNLVLFFLGGSLICIIPFYVQGMAFKYHLFPSWTFLACGAGIIFMNLIGKITKEPANLFYTLLIFFAFCYYIKPINPYYPKHSDYAHFPLTKILAPCIEKPACSFFMFHTDMGIIHETAYYSGVPHASRFATLWFLPTLLDNKEPSAFSLERRKILQEKYSALVSEDFRLKKPHFLIIAKNIEIKDQPFDFVDFFSAYKPFAEEWKNYEKIGTITLRNADYFTKSEFDTGDAVDHDIYTRRPER